MVPENCDGARRFWQALPEKYLEKQRRNSRWAEYWSLALICGGLAVAQMPKNNVSGHRHRNLTAAQRLSRQAWGKITAAQQANAWDIDGHTQKDKELLDQVIRELKMAAEAANKNKR
jgi:hypothetical protein